MNMKENSKNHRLVVPVILVLFPWLLFTENASRISGFDHFIHRNGAQLYDGEKLFRFISVNIPNLLCIEDNLPFTETNPWRLPNKFEIEDALKTTKIIGGTVARTYTITVKRNDDTIIDHKHVLAPGEFNEAAFQSLDQVLASANEIGVRLIIPFMDSWKWMGGRPQYADFRGKGENEFWTDPQIKEDYKKTISYVLNRRNTITGTLYKEDKAVLAWELGNEIWQAPADWITEMAAYVKSIDQNHLLNDGLQFFRVRKDILEDPNIDICSTHHYEPNPKLMLQHIREAVDLIDGKKPYYIGEFGFISTSSMESVLDLIIHEQNISGALIWSLRFHNRDGGFYWHSEPMGGGLYKAYHFPGFQSGESYDEKSLFELYRRKAYAIREMKIPDFELPGAPTLLAIEDVANISWQGSVGAVDYIVERSENLTGPWKIVASAVSDAEAAHEPLFSDQTAEIGKAYYYRITARNCSGKSDPSNIVGTIKVDHYTLIDHMKNFGVLFYFKGDVNPVTNMTRSFKEDFHRLAVEKKTEIIYYVPGEIMGWRVCNFPEKYDQFVEFSVSADNEQYKSVNFEQSYFGIQSRDYDYWKPYLTSSQEVPPGMHYLKLKYMRKTQIGKVEIDYGN